MKNIKSIRQENLNFLVAKARTQQALSDILDLSPAYISQMCIGTSSIGEKTARKIESSHKLPQYWMDKSRDLGTLNKKTLTNDNTINEVRLNANEIKLLKIFNTLKKTDQKQVTKFASALAMISPRVATKPFVAKSKTKVRKSNKARQIK